MKNTPRKKPGRPKVIWSSKNEALLTKHFPVMNNEEVANLLGMTVRAIRQKAFIMRLKKDGRFWSYGQEQFLVKNWDFMTAIELADELGKTKWAVINKYRELIGLRGLRKSKKKL